MEEVIGLSGHHKNTKNLPALFDKPVKLQKKFGCYRHTHYWFVYNNFI